MRHVLTIGVVALCAAPALAQAPADPASLDGAAHKLVAAATAFRAEKQVPPLVWSEAHAIVLGEQLDHLIANGYEGGPLPPGLGRAPGRARKLHHLEGEMFDNYSVVADPAAYDPMAVIREQDAHPDIKKLAVPELRLAAAAVRPQGGKWIVVLALMSGPHEEIAKVQGELAAEAERARSADKAIRHKAVGMISQRNHIEALPLLREALQHADGETRFLAVRGLSMLRSRGAIPPLVAAVGDADGIVKSTAAEALGALTGRADLGADPQKWREWWAAAAQSFVVPAPGQAPTDATPVGGAPPGAGAATTLEALIEQWQKAVPMKDVLREVATLEALREHPQREDPKAQAIMKSALKAAAPEVRLEACRAVAAQRMKSAVGPLMEMVDQWSEKHVETAQTALLALAQIGDLRSLKTFTASAWDSPEREVLITRVYAIRYLRAPESVDWLVSLFVAGRGRKGGMGGAAMRPITESLEFLTGEGHGNDPDKWRDWWKAAKGRFKPEPLPDDYKVDQLWKGEGGGGKGGKGQGGPPKKP